MKVQNNNRIDIAKIYNDNKPKASNNKNKISKTCDTIEISKESMEIAKYVNISKEIYDVRTQKVNDIKNRIQNGTYKVSSEDLAFKILETINEGKMKP